MQIALLLEKVWQNSLSGEDQSNQDLQWIDLEKIANFGPSPAKGHGPKSSSNYQAN